MIVQGSAGAQGNQGVQGSTGAQGVQGASGITTAISAGNSSIRFDGSSDIDQFIIGGDSDWSHNAFYGPDNNWSSDLFIVGRVGGASQVASFAQFQNNDLPCEIAIQKSRSNTYGSAQTAVAIGDTIGGIVFNGAAGNAMRQAGAIMGAVASTGTVSGSSLPSELQFWTNSNGAVVPTKRVTISSSGSVGIGTDTMDTSAEVSITNAASSARVYMKSADDADCSVIFGSINDAATGAIRYDHSDDSFRLYGYNNSERFRIDSTGKIGINNNSPGGAPGSIDQTNSRSTAFSATTDQRALAGIIIRQLSDAPGRFASLSFVNGGGTQAEASINLVQQGNYVGDLVIKHRTGGSSWRESLRIMDDATIRQNGATWSNNAIRAVLYNPDSTGSQIQFQHTGTTTGTSRGFRVGHNGSGGQLWNFENDYIRFATNNSLKEFASQQEDTWV